MTHLPLSAAILSLCVGWPLAAAAQTSSLFGGGGPLGQGGLTGTPSVGGPTAGGFGASGFGGAAGGLGAAAAGLGASGLGGGLPGAGGAGLGGGIGGAAPTLGAVGATVGTGAFVGASDNAGRFVGSRVPAGLGGGGAGFLPNLGQRGSNGGGNNNRAPVAAPIPLRPTQRIAFDFTPRPFATAVGAVTGRIGGLTTRRPGLAAVRIAADPEGRVVLSGDVATRTDRDLAAALARLEPGVRDVVNELTVAGERLP